MSKIRLSLEDNLAVDKAIEMVEKQDSDNPLDIETVATYQEELKALQEQKSEEESSSYSDTSSDSQSDTDSTEDTVGDIDSSDTASETDNETSDEESTTDDSDQEEKDKPEQSDKDESSEKDKESNDKTEDDQNDKESNENAEKLDKALEHLCYASELYEQLLVAKKRGTTRFIKVEDSVSKLKVIADEYGLNKTPIAALESFSDAGYTLARQNTKIALEGIKDYVKVAIEKIVAFIKSIINWLSDFFLFDPIKEQKKDNEWRARRELAKDLQKKTVTMQNFTRDAEAAIGKRTYRDRAGFLVTGSRDVTYAKAADDIALTSRVLAQYWSRTSAFVKSHVLTQMKDVVSFPESQEIVVNADILNISFASYKPIELELRSDYRTFDKNDMPDYFDIYISKDILCGNKRLALVMPAKPLAKPIEQSNGGKYYDGLIVGDSERDGNRKGISYTSDVNLLAKFAEDAQKALAEKRKLSVFITEVIRFLKRTSEKMIAAIDDFSDEELPHDIRAQNLSRLRHNLNVLNQLFDKPLISSVRFFNRIYTAADDLFDQNNKIILSVAEDIENKKKELGLNT